jgi:hypothetical protein
MLGGEGGAGGGSEGEVGGGVMVITPGPCGTTFLTEINAEPPNLTFLLFGSYSEAEICTIEFAVITPFQS